MKLKLKPVHLFLGLLAVLVVSHLGFGVKEYFENKESKGVVKSDIPEGDEHLYILKSEIVPPVCPKCPDVQACEKPKKCQPCPPCGRCPEPAFTCKKVPNYSAVENNDFIPRPVLSDFSQFGM
jgi:hypothetical protein